MTPDHAVFLIGAILALGVTLGTFGRSSWRWLRRLSHFIDDVTGEDARPGVVRRPGLVEQVDLLRQRQEEIAVIAEKAATDVAIVRRELTTNGGSSVKDVVNSTSRKLSEHLGNPDAHHVPKSR